jgi:hypothetical protein
MRSLLINPGETVAVTAKAGSIERPALLSQRDPAWRDIPLGHSSFYTIGSAGCALVCATLVARELEADLTPVVLQDRLKDAGGFWRANLNWAAVPRVVPGLYFAGITNWKSEPADIDAVYSWLDQGPVILWVDFSPGGVHNTHFVLAIERTEDDNDLLIIDPWYGAMGPLLLMYGLRGWTLERAVYGMRPLMKVNSQHEIALVTTVTAEEVDSWPEPYTP